MEFTQATAEHEPQILALGERSLGWGADERYRALYRWKHEDNPFGRSPRWVALEDGRVVGFRVFLRWAWRRGDGATARAVRAVDTATDPDFQGRGIFKTLTTASLDDLKAEGVDFIFNTPNDQSRPGYLKMGWIELGRPPVAMAPRLTSLPKVARAKVAADLWSIPSDVGAPGSALADPALAARVLGAAAPADAARWATDRTPAWLAWRFGLEPLHYRVLAAADVRGGARHGDAAAVFRLRRRGNAVEATIADLFAPTAAARRFLVRHVLEATRADYALVAATATVDAIPAVSLPAFGPLVTWRDLVVTTAPTIDDFRFAVGDLELF
jgi:GNAT superfamily N-acetyltransferase